MPTPRTPPYIHQIRKDTIEQALRDGFAPPSVGGGVRAVLVEVCHRTGIARSTQQSWLKDQEQAKARGEEHYCPDWSLYAPPKLKVRMKAGAPETEEIEVPDDYVADPEQHPTVRIRYVPDDPQGDFNIVAIGDAHDEPGLSKERFNWAGKFVADEKPDVVIQIGDFATFDSISSFAKPGSQEAKDIPTFPEDITSLEAALTAYDEGRGGFNCPHHVTLGNHEDRLLSFSGRTPQVGDMLKLELDRVLGRHGWTYSPYSLPVSYGNVSFSHVPLSIMSKPISGELATSTIAQKSIVDWVFGHSHRAEVSRRPKLAGAHVTAINLGCYLPNNYAPKVGYIKHGSMTGWWYGLWVLRINKGRIQSYKQHSIIELEERYG